MRLPEPFDAGRPTPLPPNLVVALELAEAGFHVFPCHEGPTRAKQPRVLWSTASTTDEAQIAAWWAHWPGAAPGIDLARSGHIVIDPDRKHCDGVAAWEAMEAERGPVGAPVVETPSGGRHVWFRQPPGAPLGNGTGALPAGIDVRGAGGYVIAPGAVMADGRRYRPNGMTILDAPVLPAWLAEMLAAPRAVVRSQPLPKPPPARPVDNVRLRAYAEEVLARETEKVASAAPGTRNNTLNRSAFRVGQCVGAGWIGDGEARDAFVAAVAGWSDPKKTLGTLDRGLRDGAANPRKTPEDHAAEETERGAAVARQIIEAADGTRYDAETGEVEPEPAAEAAQDDAAWLHPPGLLGAITDWIMATSRRPNRPLALAAAIVTVGTVCGRHLAGPTRSATHLYVACIGETAIGKDRPLKAPHQILDAAGLEHLATSGKFNSTSSIENLIASTPCAVATVDEIGTQLFARMSSRRASTHEAGIGGLLRELWGSSFDAYKTAQRASSKSVTVHAPALSVFGISTVDEFYNSLGGGAVDNGFLNRFLIVRAGPRADLVEDDFDPRAVPPSIVARLLAILPPAQGNMGGGAQAVFGLGKVEHDVVPWAGEDARQRFADFDREVLARIDADRGLEGFLGRTAEVAIRLATIRAVGIAGRAARVMLEDVKWGIAVADASAAIMVRDVRERMAENDHQARYKLIQRIIREAGRIGRRDLTRKIAGRIPRQDVENILKTLQEAGDVEQVMVKQAGAGRPLTEFIAR